MKLSKSMNSAIVSITAITLPTDKIELKLRGLLEILKKYLCSFFHSLILF